MGCLGKRRGVAAMSLMNSHKLLSDDCEGTRQLGGQTCRGDDIKVETTELCLTIDFLSDVN